MARNQFSELITYMMKNKYYYINSPKLKMQSTTIVIAVIIIVLIIVIMMIFGKKEHATQEPSFYKSLLDKDRANVKNKRGLTVNDYLLETKLLTGLPVSQGIKIM